MNKPGKKLSIPREMPEIQKEYQERTFALGQLRYQVHIFEKEIRQLNQRLELINNEAAARKELDAKAAALKSETSPAVVTPEVVNG